MMVNPFSSYTSTKYRVNRSYQVGHDSSFHTPPTTAAWDWPDGTDEILLMAMTNQF